jgi:hypothetical protein
VFVGFDFGTFKGARRTGQGLFAHAAQYGNQGKLASDAVSVGFFMTGHEEFRSGFYKIHQGGRNPAPRISSKIDSKIFHARSWERFFKIPV